MALSISTSRFSFYQFDGSEVIQGCGYQPFRMCLPVYLDNDVQFQFRIITTTKAEADALCDLANTHVEVGLVHEVTDVGWAILFSQKTERYRKNDNTILYNWNNGLPGFTGPIPVGGCFRIKIRINGATSFYSNCLVRVNQDCYTAVLDYNNDDDAFDFDYCGGTLIGSESDQSCEPMFIQFTNQATLSVPYTTSLIDKYGSIPTVQVWIDDGTGNLVDMGVRASFDAFPPSVISFDFGGPATGVVKIS